MIKVCDFALKSMYFHLYSTECFTKQSFFKPWIYVWVGKVRFYVLLTLENILFFFFLKERAQTHTEI